MEIRFGAPLVTRDGAHVGAIHRIVLESETQRLRAITVRTGHVFHQERVIGAAFLMESEEQGVIADLRLADVPLLPYLSDVAEPELSDERDSVQPYVTWIGGETTMASYIGSAAVNRRETPTFDLPDIDGDVTLLDSRTLVHGAEGRKTGTVVAIQCDTSGTAIGLVVRRSGIFRGREMYMPTDLASYAGGGQSPLTLEWNE